MAHHRCQLGLKRHIQKHNRHNEQTGNRIRQHNQHPDTEHFNQSVGCITERHHTIQAQHAVITQQTVDQAPGGILVKKRGSHPGNRFHHVSLQRLG